MDLKQQILLQSKGLFLRYGIKSVTMDDIARRMGISKKTLYQYVENKTDLIEQIFQQKLKIERAILTQIQHSAKDAIDEMSKIAKYVMRELRELPPTVLYDLRKYYQDTWKQMESVHKQYVFSIIKRNLEEGIKQGVYRNDINADILAKLYVSVSTIVAEEDVFPMHQYKMENLYKEFISYHIHGIASQKGLQLLETHQTAEIPEINWINEQDLDPDL